MATYNQEIIDVIPFQDVPNHIYKVNDTINFTDSVIEINLGKLGTDAIDFSDAINRQIEYSRTLEQTIGFFDYHLAYQVRENRFV
jgi:hypothetical protein